MILWLRSAILLASVIASLAAQGEAARENAPDRGLTAVIERGEGRLEWRFNDRKLLTYVFASDQFKPYVRELHTLAGDNVLQDAPADHLHHHGLMYAIRVNGVNFWEEVDKPGRQRHVELLSHEIGLSPHGLPRATFTELIHWTPDHNPLRADSIPAALLVERRTLTLTVNETADEVALAWRGEFESGPGAPLVLLHGSNYNGLGLRLPPAWDRVVRHENSERIASSPGSQPDVFPARWSAVSHQWDGGSAQLALCAQPQGQAGVNTFFTMTEPFAYLSLTQGLDKAPLQYHPGDRFEVQHLALVFSRIRTPAEIEGRYQVWSRDLR